ncbi:UDP-N-acetylmuramoyl-tripeptide--D-alanyl-D-alanine ligase [Sphingomonas sp. SFZ2018-12]|uniref:UDP-N-acetylmuramoyl-tripeptide--D-alanyl-D- alanine ligase n=1 Tax=Sphingomonas sp. SFZ2018-12 TaxID=2683197 RepID=UPI001F0F7E3B|nr:UDP-N-acetylmuramoyl-tripeptide--D-alanyl-D-alanine ligase [Sphingomonas sp. SFZ2018-12]MCH4891729.1 UDP-N-acetylmuramoyl-tripeptide--D-alanyl-D-alanine ligase [Sphingomonas sp. SFZ2018-12]
MTPLWTSAEIAAATGGTANADFVVSGVTFDSREVGPGDLFVALRGATTDGHRFLDQARAQGAAGALVGADWDGPQVRVADTMAALEALAQASRARMAGRVIGVTGSVGKTGTKEALFAALDRSAPGEVHRSVKSYNNHTGVPLSLARMPRAMRFGVFEMGMNHAGELSALTRIVRPHCALITAIAPAHIEFFKDESGIADAKAEIFEGLEPGGTAIVPFDSVHYPRLRAAAERYAGRVVSFGSGAGADVRALESMRTRTGGTYLSARVGTHEVNLTLAQPGGHWVLNALCVLAAVDAVGGDLGLAALALGELGGLAGRGERTRIDLGAGDPVLLIDESYNANPASMRATLAVLGEEAAARRIVVLGDMRELGADSPGYHAALAEPIVAAGVDFALLVGPEMAALASALEGRVDFVHVADAASARERAVALVRPGDAVLVKGSNGIGLAAVVTALKART